MSRAFLGITREQVYSPGKVEADRAILEAVADALRPAHPVTVVSGDETPPEVTPDTLVFAMCQGPAALETLARWEAAGVRVINSSRGIASTHRRRMLEAFTRHGIAHPPSLLLPTRLPAGERLTLPAWADGPVWLKRGDVHATQPDDVVQVSGRAQIEATLAAMDARGIPAALLQQHVAGDVVKFYAVRGCFFAAFPAPEAAARFADREQQAMRALAEAGAAALDLEVFGGDCVRDCQGNLWLIDLNDWPSYAPCRSTASVAIASYLTSQAGVS